MNTQHQQLKIDFPENDLTLSSRAQKYLRRAMQTAMQKSHKGQLDTVREMCAKVYEEIQRRDRSNRVPKST